MDATERARATIRETWKIVQEHGDGRPLTVFSKLHAILCASHGWDWDTQIAFGKMIDRVEIAKELDRIREALSLGVPVLPPELGV